MRLGNDRRRWGVISATLHWLVAALVITMIGLGIAMTELVGDLERKFALYQLHKSIGITVFLVMLVRLGWRVSQPVPDLPDGLKPFERRLARLTHGGFYAVLLLMPLAGWVATESSPLAVPTRVFGLVTLPNPFGPNERLHELFEGIHEAFAWCLILLVTVHVAAALKHHFVLRDDVLRRMLLLPGGDDHKKDI